MVSESLHCPFVCESFNLIKLAAFTKKLYSQTQLNEILAVIVQFTDSFLHNSSRHRCTTIKSSIELSIEIVLVGMGVNPGGGWGSYIPPIFWSGGDAPYNHTPHFVIIRCLNGVSSDYFLNKSPAIKTQIF